MPPKKKGIENEEDAQPAGVSAETMAAFDVLLKKHFEKAEAKLETRFNLLNTRLDGFETTLSKHGEDITSLGARVKAIEENSPNDAATGSKVKFDPEVTLIVAGLVYEENEDIKKKVHQLFQDGLGEKSVVADVLRLNGRGNHPGVVKVECSSLDEKIAILRKKQKLRDHPNDSYRKVYIRSAKSHTDRLIELNFKTLLREFPNGKDYYVTGSGRLTRRDDRGNWNDRPTQRGSERGYPGYYYEREPPWGDRQERDDGRWRDQGAWGYSERENPGAREKQHGFHRGGTRQRGRPRQMSRNMGNQQTGPQEEWPPVQRNLDAATNAPTHTLPRPNETSPPRPSSPLHRHSGDQSSEGE